MRTKNIEFFMQSKIILLVLLLFGFIVGMACSFWGENVDNGSQGVWLDNVIMYLKYGEIHYANMLFYIVEKRFSLIILILLLCFIRKGRYLLLAGVAIAGGFAGFFITEFIQYKGILGSGLFLVSIFPHYLCYGYGYYYLLEFLSAKSSDKNPINQFGQKTITFFDEKNKTILKKFTPILVVIMGLLLECYVNPFFVKIFLKIFM